MIKMNSGTPTETGTYACTGTGGTHHFLTWLDGEWCWVDSDRRFPFPVLGWVGPLVPSDVEIATFNDEFVEKVKAADSKVIEAASKVTTDRIRAAVGLPPMEQAPTCGACGATMRFNVPRLGPAGGFVHADTGKLLCRPEHTKEIP